MSGYPTSLSDWVVDKLHKARFSGAVGTKDEHVLAGIQREGKSLPVGARNGEVERHELFFLLCSPVCTTHEIHYFGECESRPNSRRKGFCGISIESSPTVASTPR